MAAAQAANKEREKEKDQQRKEKELSVQSVLSRASTPATGILEKDEPKKSTDPQEVEMIDAAAEFTGGDDNNQNQPQQPTESATTKMEKEEAIEEVNIHNNSK